MRVYVEANAAARLFETTMRLLDVTSPSPSIDSSSDDIRTGEVGIKRVWHARLRLRQSCTLSPSSSSGSDEKAEHVMDQEQQRPVAKVVVCRHARSEPISFLLAECDE